VRIRRIALLFVGVLVQAGCVNPQTTRVPELAPRGSEYERRESQIQDPYPDKELGPEVGFRPREFQQQRSEVQRSKDRSYSSFLRSRVGPAGSAAPPAQFYPPTAP
jgi:hypothetical protein